MSKQCRGIDSSLLSLGCVSVWLCFPRQQKHSWWNKGLVPQVSQAQLWGTKAPRAQLWGTKAPSAQLWGTKAPRAQLWGTKDPFHGMEYVKALLHSKGHTATPLQITHVNVDSDKSRVILHSCEMKWSSDPQFSRVNFPPNKFWQSVLQGQILSSFAHRTYSYRSQQHSMSKKTTPQFLLWQPQYPWQHSMSKMTTPQFLLWQP